jgi:hypothetical protein
MQAVLGFGAGHTVYWLHAVRSETGCEAVRLDPDEDFALPDGDPFETWEFESGLAIPEHEELYCAIGEAMQELSGMVP